MTLTFDTRFLISFAGMPQDTYNIWLPHHYRFTNTICILQGLLSETSTNATVLTITSFTIERYIAICHPFRFVYSTWYMIYNLFFFLSLLQMWMESNKTRVFIVVPMLFAYLNLIFIRKFFYFCRQSFHTTSKNIQTTKFILRFDFYSTIFFLLSSLIFFVSAWISSCVICIRHAYKM